MTTLAHGGHEAAETIVATAPVIAGLIAGAAHVFTGPDHLAAVAPLAVEQQKRPWLAGVLWGLGHSGGVWVLAVLALVFREALPVEAMSSWSERLVGVVLIGVGIWGLHRVVRLHAHTHRHTHAGADGAAHTHEHTHVHAVPARAGREHRHARHDHSHSLFGIGALHGVAGTAHLLGVLPALAMPDRASAVAYVVSFGVGSILGMGLFTAGLGMLVRATNASGRGLTRGLMSVCSAGAIGVGVYWLTAA